MVMEVKLLHHSKQPLPKFVTELGILMDAREEQPLKHHPPKLVTEDGITVPAHPQIIVLLSVSITALQFSRESYTEFPASTTIDLREEQPLKQYFPKLVTEDGILMDVREEQPLKQYSPKLVTEDGITVPAHPQIMVLLSVSITALQFSRESYTEFPASTTMDVREEQREKQFSPKLVTEDGILMDVREEQPSKQYSPKLVMEDGILMDVREEQPPKQ